MLQQPYRHIDVQIQEKQIQTAATGSLINSIVSRSNKWSLFKIKWTECYLLIFTKFILLLRTMSTDC